MSAARQARTPATVLRYLVGAGMLLLAAIYGLLVERPNPLNVLFLVVVGIALLVLGGGGIVRPGVTRGPDGISCRFVPWYETTVYGALLFVPLMGVFMIAAPPFPESAGFFRILGIAVLAVTPVSLFIFLRQWRRCLLRISPTGLTVSAPDRGYALTGIAREQIQSITPTIGSHVNGSDMPMTQITYQTTGSTPGGAAEAVLLAPSNSKKSVWLTVSQPDLLAALRLWQAGDPTDPGLLDRTEAILRGQDRDALTSAPGQDDPLRSSAAGAAAPRAGKARNWIPAALIAAAAALGAAYPIWHSAHTGDGTPPAATAPAAGETGCPVSGARTLTLAKNSDTEPAVYVPITAGWTQDTTSAEATTRAQFSNPALRANDVTPTLQVVLDTTTEPGSAVADELFGKAAKVFTTVERSTATVCGNTVYRADTTGKDPAGKATEYGTTLLTVVPGAEATRWVVFANLTTTNPNDPGYVAQRDALVKGFYARAA